MADEIELVVLYTRDGKNLFESRTRINPDHCDTHEEVLRWLEMMRAGLAIHKPGERLGSIRVSVLAELFYGALFGSVLLAIVAPIFRRD